MHLIHFGVLRHGPVSRDSLVRAHQGLQIHPHSFGFYADSWYTVNLFTKTNGFPGFTIDQKQNTFLIQYKCCRETPLSLQRYIRMKLTVKMEVFGCPGWQPYRLFLPLEAYRSTYKGFWCKNMVFQWNQSKQQAEQNINAAGRHLWVYEYISAWVWPLSWKFLYGPGGELIDFSFL